MGKKDNVPISEEEKESGKLRVSRRDFLKGIGTGTVAAAMITTVGPAHEAEAAPLKGIRETFIQTEINGRSQIGAGAGNLGAPGRGYWRGGKQRDQSAPEPKAKPKPQLPPIRPGVKLHGEAVGRRGRTTSGAPGVRRRLEQSGVETSGFRSCGEDESIHG